MSQDEQPLAGVVIHCGHDRVGDGTEGSEKVVKMICSGSLKLSATTHA
jgi:hypothetical protein